MLNVPTQSETKRTLTQQPGPMHGTRRGLQLPCFSGTDLAVQRVPDESRQAMTGKYLVYIYIYIIHWRFPHSFLFQATGMTSHYVGDTYIYIYMLCLVRLHESWIESAGLRTVMTSPRHIRQLTSKVSNTLTFKSNTQGGFGQEIRNSFT